MLEIILLVQCFLSRNIYMYIYIQVVIRELTLYISYPAPTQSSKTQVYSESV